MGSRLYRLITQGDYRRACSLSAIGNAGIGLDTVFAALRSHGLGVNRMRSVCMHGGGLVNNATTASMVVELRPTEHHAVIWFTAGSAPCLSVYRPAVLESGSFCPMWTDYDYREGLQGGMNYWKKRRAATKPLLRGRGGAAQRDPAFAARRDEAQSRLVSLMEGRVDSAQDAGVIAEIGKTVREFEG